MKYFKTIVIIMILFFQMNTLADNTQKNSEPDLATPENSINWFVKNLSNQNPQKALRACAVAEMSEKFNFKNYTKRMNAFVLYDPAEMPSEYKMFTDMNETLVKAYFYKQMKLFIYSLLTKIPLNRAVQYKTEDEIDKFIIEVNPKMMKSLEIVKIDIPRKDFQYNNERYLEVKKRQAKVYEADDITERMVLYKLGRKYFAGGFRLFRYGDSWKIVSLYSSLAGLQSNGSLEETTVKIYENRVNYRN